MNYQLLICLVLAAFLKTTAGLYAIAYALFLVWKYRKGYLHTKFILSSIVLLIAAVFIYFYLSQLVIERNKSLWSTLFLASSAKIESFAQLTEVLKALWRWKLEYLNPYQWIVISLAIIWTFYTKRRLGDFAFYLIITSGVLGVLYLFGAQFINHDYYALASFMPLLIYLGMRAIAKIPRKGIAGIFALICLSILSFSYGSNQHFDRMSETCTIHNQHYTFEFNWMKKNADQIKSIVEEDEMIFVVYGMEPNLSLSYFDRNGIVFNHEEMGRSESNFYYWLERRKPMYTLVRKKYADLFKKEHAEYFYQTELQLNHADFVLLKNRGH